MFDPPEPPDFSDNIKPETPEAHIWIQASLDSSPLNSLSGLESRLDSS